MLARYFHVVIHLIILLTAVTKNNGMKEGYLIAPNYSPSQWEVLVVGTALAVTGGASGH